MILPWIYYFALVEMEKDDAPDSMDVDAVEHDLSHSVQKIHISPQKDQQRKRKRSIWEDEIDQDREEGLIGTADEDTDEAPSATLALASSRFGLLKFPRLSAIAQKAVLVILAFACFIYL